jgi:hypothetical protein
MKIQYSSKPEEKINVICSDDYLDVKKFVKNIEHVLYSGTLGRQTDAFTSQTHIRSNIHILPPAHAHMYWRTIGAIRLERR